ncbi:MAG TPA: hypothetical protein VFN68_11525 [Acidimicrobiales bacterium]|nr:hypothetical protein [Acidimicrobiales bacterium]
METFLRGGDPFSSLRWSERRAWRSAERRVRHDHEAQQLAVLRDLAATASGVTGLSVPPDRRPGRQPDGATPVEMIIDGRRLRAARMPRRSLATLRDALAGLAAVPLTAVGRYGPYWVLTFKLATEPLVVLADHLTLLPDWGGGGGRRVPTGPLATLGV